MACKTCNKKRRSRSRVRGVGGGNVTNLLMMVAGGILAQKAPSMLDNIPVVGSSQALKNALPAAIGYFMMQQSNPTLSTLGTGMLVVGAAKTVGAVVPALSGGAGQFYLGSPANLPAIAV